MSSNPQFADATVITGMAAELALANGGVLAVYSGSQPADANTAVTTQTLLAALTLSSPAFGTPAASGSAGSRTVTATARSITGDSSAEGSGTATWFRIYRSDGTTPVCDGTAGASGTDLVLSSAAVFAGGSVSVSSLTISQPEG